MSIMDMTVEETNLIAIYKADTIPATLARIAAVIPDLDEEMRSIARHGAAKLSALTEAQFSALSFAPADDIDEG